MKDEKNNKVQWINIHRNDSFVNWMQLPLLCEQSGAILLVLVGLMAGRQSEEILKKFKVSKDTNEFQSVF